VQIVVKNPTGNVEFGAIWNPPGEYSVWFPIVPRALAIDEKGNIYIGDSVNYRVLKYNKEGKYLLQFKLQPSKRRKTDQLSHIIQEMSFDDMGNLNVLNYFENRIEVFKPDGTFIMFAASTSQDIEKFIKKSSQTKYGNITYQVNVFAPDPKIPGRLYFKIKETDNKKKLVKECIGPEANYDEFGLIYEIGLDGYIYTIDYGGTLNVLRISLK